VKTVRPRTAVSAHLPSSVTHRLIVALSILMTLTSACGLKLPSQINLPTAATATDPSHQVEVVSFTQVGNSLSVRLRNPNPDVGLVRSPFELAMIDKAGAVIATEGQGGVPGASVNTIYQLPPGGEFGLDISGVPSGKAVASVELTVLGEWLKWDTGACPNPRGFSVTIHGEL
jgi:predicted small lipoprotein YifL